MSIRLELLKNDFGGLGVAFTKVEDRKEASVTRGRNCRHGMKRNYAHGAKPGSAGIQSEGTQFSMFRIANHRYGSPSLKVLRARSKQ